MPRTSAVELPGCPPLRALTTDILSLVKVVEARGKSSIPKVVDTWSPPDASRAVDASSFADHDSRPLVAVARKNNPVEIFNPLNGDALAAFKVGETSSLENYVEEDPIAGLHLLKTKRDELSSSFTMFIKHSLGTAEWNSRGRTRRMLVENLRALRRLKTACERAKRTLSSTAHF